MCNDKPQRKLACLECRSRKIRCDLQKPCENCERGKRPCSEYRLNRSGGQFPQNTSSPLTPHQTLSPVSQSTTQSYSSSGLADPPRATFPTAQVSEPTDDIFSIENWNIDPFPSMLPFWPDPLLLSDCISLCSHQFLCRCYLPLGCDHCP
jgi:hypothetical protein